MQELSYYFLSIDHNIALPSKSVCHICHFSSGFLIRIFAFVIPEMYAVCSTKVISVDLIIRNNTVQLNNNVM